MSEPRRRQRWYHCWAAWQMSPSPDDDDDRTARSTDSHDVGKGAAQHAHSWMLSCPNLHADKIDVRVRCNQLGALLEHDCR